jgi:mismatch-specific thymine-DNA glycosylase
VLDEKYGEMPLRLLFVGHNPSQHSWDSGHYYSQPSNRFWKLLIESGIVAGDIETVNDDLLVQQFRIGFTDVIRVPNSDAASLKRRHFVEQRDFFYKRISSHANRVKAHPEHIAFVGKRQFSMLFEPPLKRVELGLQNLVPPHFPLDAKIWVLSSPSGRAAMTWKERLEPYLKLSKSMHGAFFTSNIE